MVGTALGFSKCHLTISAARREAILTFSVPRKLIRCASLVVTASVLVSVTSIAQTSGTITKPAAAECRPEGTSQYSSNDYTLLKDMLAYDQGRGLMSVHVMTAKALQLLYEVEYERLRTLLRACAPQFVERSLGDVLLPKKNIWRGKLTRSEVILYDDGQQFLPDVIVLLTGLP